MSQSNLPKNNIEAGGAYLCEGCGILYGVLFNLKEKYEFECCCSKSCWNKVNSPLYKVLTQNADRDS